MEKALQILEMGGSTNVQKTHPDFPIKIVLTTLPWGGREKAFQSQVQGLLSLNSDGFSL